MIDFHAHILPNLDDGSKNIEETMQILQEAQENGFTKVIATTHYIEGYYEVNEEKRKIWINELNQVLQEKRINVQIELGSEIYITENIIELIKNKKASTIGKKYVLFELPFNHRIIRIENIIYTILENGFIPIIAHPERYEIVNKNPNIVYEWIALGVLLQANFGSIIGQYGNESKRTAKTLLEHNMIHFLGTDVHRARDIYLKMPVIMKNLSKILTKEKIEEVTNGNAKKVLLNEVIDIDMPVKVEQNKWKKYIQPTW